MLLARGAGAYIALAVLGASPVAIAPLIGVWHSRTMAVLGRVHCVPSVLPFRGMDAAYNWWIFPVALPLALFLLRLTAVRTLGAADDRTDFTPPAVTLIDPPACNGRRDELVRLSTHPVVYAIVLALVVGIHVIDVKDVARAHAEFRAGGAISCPPERDWTVYFLAKQSNVNEVASLAHAGVAYACQFIAAFLALSIFALFLVHNVFYLRLIFQRHSDSPADSIVLDFDHPDECFGQNRLYPIFNLQILFLVAAGVFILFSRYRNVSTDATKNASALLEQALDKASGPFEMVVALLKWIRTLGLHDLFHDEGQVILASSFVLVFLIIGIPSLIKFLPFRQMALFNNGMAPYLAEFVPPGGSEDPLHMNHDELVKFAGKFARNSFWPAGDPKAERLFAFVYLVLLFIFIPIPFRPVGAFLIALVLLLGAAVLLTVATFTGYQYVLGYVGKPLTRKPEPKE